jgi:hypothetical protein
MKAAGVIPPDSDLLLTHHNDTAFARRGLCNVVDKRLCVATLVEVLRRWPVRLIEPAPRP